MLASPFFTAGRAAILPSIATQEELHTANSLTQTTQWTTLTIGTFLGGASVAQFGYQWAFVAQCAVVPDLGVVHLAAVPAGRDSARRAARSPRRTWSGRGTSTRKGCATCARCR